jgi:hypothetical protein
LDRTLLREKIISVMERGRAAEMVQMRDDILQAVTSAAESLLLNVEWESLIEEVLRQLGVATGSDRVYIFKNDGTLSENLGVSLKGEWVAKGVLSNKDLIMLMLVPMKIWGMHAGVNYYPPGNCFMARSKNYPTQSRRT